MSRNRIAALGDIILRSYGQLFLCNRKRSGALFFGAMILASPIDGALSLLGASIVTLIAFRIAPTLSALKSGLFGVNGILAGYLWILFPEVPIWTRTIATVAGCLGMSLLMWPAGSFLQRHESSLSLFTLPSILLLWFTLSVLGFLNVYDADALRGWHSYFAGNYSEAEKSLLKVEAGHPRAAAYKSDGLGWCRFKLGDFEGAITNFSAAVEAAPNFADPSDGLGWSCFKLNRFDQSRQYFAQALDRDPLLADSWNGLGWINSLQGNPMESIACFRNAIMICPLLPDSYQGYAGALKAFNPNYDPSVAIALHRFGQAHFPRGLWFVTSFQILGWVLFLSGIVLHSWISGAIVCCGLVLAGVISPYLSTQPISADINFYYNLAAVLVALGGHYLVLSVGSICWTLAMVSLVLVMWQPLTSTLLTLGLPASSLPFNLILVGTLTIFTRLVRTSKIQPAPLDVAITDPITVLRWNERVKTFSRCSRLLRNLERRKSD